MKTRHFLSIAVCLVLSVSGYRSSAQISSSFDSGDDGWVFSSAHAHNASGGNPGGYLSATYSASATSTSQYWIAPAKFRGNQVMKSLGMELKFDLQQSDAGTASGSSGDVRIESNSTTLVISLGTKPALAPAWTSYAIKLDETAGWKVSSTAGVLATRSQIIAVLSNITAIEIRGTYMTLNPYTSGIDNVILEQRTLATPPAYSYLSTWQAEPGTQITIEGSNFGATAADNAVFFGSTPAEVVSAAANFVTVTVPKGSTYGYITVVNKTTGLSVCLPNKFNPLFKDGGRIIQASFDPRESITLTSEPTAVVLADVDADGYPDILVGESSNVVNIFRNLGLGGNLSASSFAAPVTLTGAGNSPALSLTDLDGDGKSDIVASYTSGSLNYFATFRNTSSAGNVSFEAVELWSGLVYSGRLSAVGDIDGDGRADLIGQHGNGSVNVDFWIASNISTPGNIEFGASMAFFGSSLLDAGAGASLADLDSDGKLDVVVEHNFGNSFSILHNTSTPSSISFDAPVSFSEGVNGGVQMADLNQDGHLDLLWKKGFSNDDITILLNTNNFDGLLDASDFATKVVVNSDLFNYGAVGLADINGDGKVDITASDASNVGIFENVFDGGDFTAASIVAAYVHQGAGGSTYPGEVLAADLNGDDRPDLVTNITNTTPGRIYIYENKNTHTPAISLNTVSPLSGAVGTMVTITGDYFSPVPANNLVRFGTIRASVVSATRTTLKVRVPAGASIGPVSVTSNGLTSEYHLPFQVTFSYGSTFDDSMFAPPISFALVGADYDIDVADVDGDNKPDVVAEGTGQRAYSFLNTHTTGAISATSLSPDDTTASNAANPRIVDLDGDGRPDIVSLNGVYQNNSAAGDVAFSAITSLSAGGNFGFADFNHDGKIDLVGVNSGVAEVTENRTREGLFETVTPYESFRSYNYTKPAANGGSAAADFDNDGLADFAVTNPGSDNISIFRNNGSYRISTTQFTAEPVIAVGDNPGRLYHADLDRDGRIDLVLYYSVTTTSQFVTVLHNQSSPGSISFNRVDYAIGVNATTATLSDLDGDGRCDIIVASESGNRFVILKNNSTGGTIDATSFAAPFNTAVTAPRGVHTGDLNLDGRPEILLTRAAGFLLVYESLVPAGAISIDSQPANLTACYGQPSFLTVSASGGMNITYQWQRYDIEKLDFTDIVESGAITGTKTATLTVPYTGTFFAGQYRCVISADNLPDVISAVSTVTVLDSPGEPTVTPATVCVGASALISASGGADGAYRWYVDAVGGTPIPNETSDSYQTPNLTATTTYYVSIGDGACESERVALTVTVDNSGTCNSPPVIETANVETAIGGTAVISLLTLISDPDNNLDLTSLRIVVPPASGAEASIDANQNLILDYSGLSFSGADQLTIEACDQAGSCVQQIITILIEGGLVVYNGISPNGDDSNDYWRIENIGAITDARDNDVKIFNRWGDLVWEGTNYDNDTVVFTGRSKSGKELPTGTYFYQIVFRSGRAQLSGYLSLKR